MPTPSAEWMSTPKRGRVVELLWPLRKVTPWQWMLTLLVFILVMTMQLWRLSRDRTSIPFIVALVPMFGMFAYPLLVLHSFERPDRWLTKRLRMRSSKDAYPVIASVVRNFVILGQSEGLVTIEGGILRFEGEMTSFVLGRGDALAPSEAYEGWPETEGDELRRSFGSWESGEARAFSLTQDDNVWVTFFPLKARGFASVWKPLFGWLQSEPIPFEGTILPPLGSQPGYQPPHLTGGKRKKVRSRLMG